MDQTAALAARPPSLERFFPGCFEILLPAISTALPHIFAAFRVENHSRTAEAALSDQELDRAFAELLSLVAPLLSEVLPVLIEQIHDFGEQRARAGAGPVDDEALERFLPPLLGALVPVLVEALPPALQGVGGLIGGLFGVGREGEPPLPHVIDSEVSSRFLGPILQALLPAVAESLPVLFSLITGQGSQVSRDMGVSWADFADRHRLWDNDMIRVWTEPIDDPNAVEIALELARHKTWGKAIQVEDDSGGFVAEVSVKDSKKVDVVRVDARTIVDADGYLLFKKAKLFGVMTGMYRLKTGGLQQLRGRRATFYWSAD
ncbi:hypothetical protein [Streptomyces europaeiscabiei]|nr:hypothetical protein [Streptomyces europaeiscabiei]MDX3619237.1 hypothetical protein [Streptomyces europaeiscabiei]